MGKISTHIMLKYINCRRNHKTITFKYLLWVKIQKEVWKNNLKKSTAKNK